MRECGLFWVDGALLWVGGGGFGIILGGWRWVGKHFGWVEFDCLIMSNQILVKFIFHQSELSHMAKFSRGSPSQK